MRWAVWLLAVVALAGVCWLFPLFHVVPLAQAEKAKSAGVFNPAAFAEKFWAEQLVKSLDRAVQADELLAAIRNDAGAAKRKFSRSLGVSESYNYFVTGSGRVLVVSEDEVALAVTPGTTNAEVSLQVGLLFGNAVRDGTGLLTVSDYPNSQDFNGISEALNHLIEARVLPKLREQAKVGAVVKFTGCAEVNDESVDLQPLKVVPVRADVE